MDKHHTLLALANQLESFQIFLIVRAVIPFHFPRGIGKDSTVIGEGFPSFRNTTFFLLTKTPKQQLQYRLSDKSQLHHLPQFAY